MGGAFRRMHGEIEDTQFGRNVAALKAELDEEEAERDQVTGEAKTKIQAKTDVTRAKLQAIQNGIQARIDSSKQEMEAKIKSLREQAVKACSQWKAKL